MKRSGVVSLVVFLTLALFSLALAQSPAGETKNQPTPAAEPPKSEVPTITPGLYNGVITDFSFTKKDHGFKGTGTLKLQMELKTDGTFTYEEYATVAEADLKDELVIKSRGKWKQEGEKMIYYELLDQYFDYETGKMKPWQTPADGKTSDTYKVRNITKDTFQEYEPRIKSWMTWSKL